MARVKVQKVSAEDAVLYADFLAKYEHDPLGFVKAVFPWGEGELKGRTPDKWQTKVLKDIGAGLKKKNMGVIQEAVASGHGVGKALENSTNVPTPHGIYLHGELDIGDYVFGADGKPTKIVGIPYKGVRPCYKVTFDDGSSVVCSQEHLWTVKGRQERRNKKGWITLETQEILRRGVKRPNGASKARQWEIPIQGAVQYPYRYLPIHPYVMGLLIGDGSFRTGRITTSGEGVCKHLSDVGIEFSKKDRETNCYDLYIRQTKRELADMELADLRSWEKYIPYEYLASSVEQRRELLRGLIDTDGEVNKQGSIVYNTTSKELADNVVWLARSLSCKARIQPTAKKTTYLNNGEKKQGRDCYRVTITLPFDFGEPCYNKHKAERVHLVEKRYMTRWIDSIEYVGRRKTTCISVEASDGLYQVDNFIVTHNSALVSWLILWALCTKADTRGVVTANTEGQLLKKTWPEVAKWYRMMICKDLFAWTATSLFSVDKEHEATWRIDAIPWNESNPEAFAGLHNQGRRILVIFDEASAIADNIWETTEGALTDDDTEIIWCCFGNPTRNTGRFHSCFYRFRNRWNCLQVDSRDVKISNKKQLQTWIDDYGEDSDFVKVRIKGEFPSASENQLISTELAELAAARRPEKKQYEFAPAVIGVDPAWTGTDSLAIVLRQGVFSKVLELMPKNEDDMRTAGKIARYQDVYGAVAVFIDLGYGTGIFSAGKTMGRTNWRLVSFAEKPLKDGFANKRAEMWSDMKDWLKEGGSIDGNDTLLKDLVAPEVFINKSGKLQLESKQEMKKRGMPSPNAADALALTFAYPVSVNSNSKYRMARRKGGIRKYGRM